jgi:serine/threonine protein kinase
MNGPNRDRSIPSDQPAEERLFAGRYESLRLLGRGGMGEVHLARDAKFGRLVAIKLFKGNRGNDAAIARFIREASLAGGLSNPHIVTIYDFGEHEGELYIAMEYVAGQSLADLIARHQPGTLKEKLLVMLDLCQGLGYAHDAGVVHRDIKPANLMLSAGGTLKIVDFGIARALASDTATQPLLGSLSYMSPEQLAFQPLDARSDIFSVGAVFYELLTFQQAFGAGSVDEVIDRIRTGAPEPLAMLCPDLPVKVIDVVSRALEREPDARFQDLHELEQAIREILRDVSTGVRVIAASEQPDANEVVQADPSDTPAVPNPSHDDSWWARAQERLLDSNAMADYMAFAVLGAIPLAIAWLMGLYNDVNVSPQSVVYDSCVALGGSSLTVQGYGSRLNWWPYFAFLPFVLFVLRRTAAQLFPMQLVPEVSTGIVRMIPPAGRWEVAARLRIAATDPRNLRFVVAIAIAINIIDVLELIPHYTTSAQTAGCPRELDWTVRFLADPQTLRAENLMLVVFAYACQFVAHSLALMLFGLLLRHNVFYLKLIYQRHRAARVRTSQQIVLDFDDVERCFGLRVLHSTFNYQVVLLIVGGVCLLASRFMNVDATPIGIRYEALIQRLVSTESNPPLTPLPSIGLGDLFPDAGQIMLGLAWLTCFFIVALPSAVKFLPLIYKHVRLVGRREYLLEFVPPATNIQANTAEELDQFARKFSRSSFWPAGDERARTLYTLAYFVFFVVLVSVPPTSRTALALHLGAVFVIAYSCMKFTFWLFHRALINVDATLAER